MTSAKARAPALTPVPGSPLSSSPTKAKRSVGSRGTPARSSVRTASIAVQSPALRSLAPRPQTAPSTIAPPNGFSRSVPAQCSFQPRTCTVSVCPSMSNMSAPARPLRRPQTFGRPGANSRRATRSAPIESSSSFIMAAKVGLFTSDAPRRDRTAEQGERVRPVQSLTEARDG